MARKQQRSLLALLAVCLALPAAAQIDLVPLNSTHAFTWSTGDVSAQVSLCVESFQEAPDKKSSNVVGYDISASIGGTAPFTLANANGQTIPASLTWTDTLAGTTSALAPEVALTGQTGALAACPGGNNGLITIVILNAELGAAPQGTYTRQFAVEVSNGGSGRSRRRGNVTISVTIPPVIRVSDINDLVLGTFDGISNMAGSDTVCVYMNGGTLYSITASGSGAGSAFSIANGSSIVPYAVTWQDTLGTAALASGVQAANRGNAFTADTSCNGGAGNNATVTVTLQAADLLTAMQPGLYSGVLTLMVAPQ